MTIFSDLPNEMVIEIFKYLTVAEQYDSFFDLNRRFRTLVKQWTTYSHAEFKRDFIRFCSLHSWYKVGLKDGGRLCFIYPRRGQQSSINQVELNDEAKNLHWWVHYDADEINIEDQRIQRIVAEHSFRLTPFCYRCDFSQKSSRSFDSATCSIVVTHQPAVVQSWLKINYPEYADQIISEGVGKPNLYRPIVQAECLKLWTTVREKVDQIWKELRYLEDVNPLDIHAEH